MGPQGPAGSAPKGLAAGGLTLPDHMDGRSYRNREPSSLSERNDFDDPILIDEPSNRDEATTTMSTRPTPTTGTRHHSPAALRSHSPSSSMTVGTPWAWSRCSAIASAQWT